MQMLQLPESYDHRVEMQAANIKCTCTCTHGIHGTYCMHITRACVHMQNAHGRKHGCTHGRMYAHMHARSHARTGVRTNARTWACTHATTHAQLQDVECGRTEVMRCLLGIRNRTRVQRAAVPCLAGPCQYSDLRAGHGPDTSTHYHAHTHAHACAHMCAHPCTHMFTPARLSGRSLACPTTACTPACTPARLHIRTPTHPRTGKLPWPVYLWPI